jgi:hypothetical protein
MSERLWLKKRCFPSSAGVAMHITHVWKAKGLHQLPIRGIYILRENLPICLEGLVNMMSLEINKRTAPSPWGKSDRSEEITHPG